MGLSKTDKNGYQEYARQVAQLLNRGLGARTALRFAVSYSQIGRKDNTAELEYLANVSDILVLMS